MKIERNYLNLYEVVTNTVEEIPLCVGTMRECCEYLGISQSTARRMMSMHETGLRKEWDTTWKMYRLGLKEDRNGHIKKS